MRISDWSSDVCSSDLLGDSAARHNLADAAMAGPGIDILINNAGAIPVGTLDAMDDATWRAAWELKMFGYIDLTRAIYPALCSSEERRVGKEWVRTGRSRWWPYH